MKVRYRIDLNEPIQQAWRSSINGHAAFAPKPIDLIRALPDNGRTSFGPSHPMEVTKTQIS